jgi:hypothetical protein
MPTQYMVNNLLFTSASNGDFSEIKRLLTSSELNIKADIHFFNDSCLVLACERGDTEIVRFLLTSPELTEHAYLHADNYQPFKALCINDQLDTISYLIFDFNMELAEPVKYYLNNSDLEICKVVKSLFEKREISKNLHRELDSSLQKNKSASNKLKI